MAKSSEKVQLWSQNEVRSVGGQHISYGGVTGAGTGRKVELEKMRKKWILVFIAYTLLIMSMFLCCASVSCVQVLGGAIPEFELNAWRFMINFLVSLPVVMCQKCDVIVPRSKLPHMVAQFFFALLYNVTYYEAALYLPVGTAFALNNSVVVAGNAALSICFKGERKLPLYLGAVLVIIGLLMMTQPSFMFPGGILPPAPVVDWTSPCITDMDDILFANTSTSGNQVEGHNIDNIWVGYILAFYSNQVLVACFICLLLNKGLFAIKQSMLTWF